MGRLRNEMQELDIADNTVLWYTSDNGALRVGSAGGLRGFKGELYEGGVREPTIIEWPSHITQPRRTSVVSGTVDIFPTLLEIAGIEVSSQPHPLDGMSLLPLIDGATDARLTPLGFWVYPRRGHSVPSYQLLSRQRDRSGNDAPIWSYIDTIPASDDARFSESELPGRAAWIDGDWKLHRIPQNNGTASYELYNLKADMAETTNIIDDNTTRAEKMKAELEAWQQSVIRSANGDDYSSS